MSFCHISKIRALELKIGIFFILVPISQDFLLWRFWTSNMPNHLAWVVTPNRFLLTLLLPVIDGSYGTHRTHGNKVPEVHLLFILTMPFFGLNPCSHMTCCQERNYLQTCSCMPVLASAHRPAWP